MKIPKIGPRKRYKTEKEYVESGALYLDCFKLLVLPIAVVFLFIHFFGKMLPIEGKIIGENLFSIIIFISLFYVWFSGSRIQKDNDNNNE